MQLLDLTLDTAAENLALDEALLDTAELGSAPNEVLRLWEPRELIVVAGSSSRLADEVNLDVCHQRGIPVLRRASGGATIVTGPGCLMYAIVLSYENRPHLRPINQAHQFVLETIAAALNRSLSVPTVSSALSGATGSASASGIRREGISDLAINGQKFSGNSLRCKQTHFLYHGTLLYQFPLNEISALLKMPIRQPHYRQQRSHANFVTNLPMAAATIRRSVTTAFAARTDFLEWPMALTRQLVAEKYNQLEWNQRF